MSSHDQKNYANFWKTGDFLNCLLFMTTGKIYVLNILFTLGKQSQPVN